MSEGDIPHMIQLLFAMGLIHPITGNIFHDLMVTGYHQRSDSLFLHHFWIL
jgi:hypothetical protein